MLNMAIVQLLIDEYQKTAPIQTTEDGPRLSTNTEQNEKIKSLENRVKVLSKKNEDLSKKLKQQDQSSVVHVPKYDYEIHKLKLKIVSLESQNDFLVQKNKTLEHQVSTQQTDNVKTMAIKSNTKKPLKKKKKLPSKQKIEDFKKFELEDNADIETDAQTESKIPGDISFTLVEKQTSESKQIPKDSLAKKEKKSLTKSSKVSVNFEEGVKPGLNQVTTPAAGIQGKVEELGKFDDEKDSGVLHPKPKPTGKKNPKKLQKKKTTSQISLQTILTNISSLTFTNFWQDVQINSTDRTTPNCLYEYSNYETFIELILELFPALKTGGFQLLTDHGDYFSRVLTTFYTLLTSKSKVYFEQNQEFVGIPTIFPINYQTKNEYWNRFLTASDKGKNNIKDQLLNKIAANPLNYKFLVQKSIQDEFLGILAQLANFCRNNLFELRAKLYKLKDFTFFDHPKGKEMRFYLTRLRKNLFNRINYTKLLIISNKLTILIMPPAKNDVTTYLKHEIDEALSDKNWGGLIRELYGSLEGFTDNRTLSELTSEAPDYNSSSSCSEHSRIGDIEGDIDVESGLLLGIASKEQYKRHYLETMFGSDAGKKLREWYLVLTSQNEELVTLSEAVKEIDVDVFRPKEVQQEEVQESGILDGWVLHVDGVLQEVSWENSSDSSEEKHR